MAYNASIPQPNDQLSQSQIDLLANFQAIATAFQTNHGDFNSGVQGLHKFITFPRQAGDPVVVGTDVAIYTKLNANTALSEIYFNRPSDGSLFAMTATSFTTNGYAYLPGGILLKWGAVSNTIGGTDIDATSGGPAYSTVLNAQVTLRALTAFTVSPPFPYYITLTAAPAPRISLNGVPTGAQYYYFVIGY